MKLTKQINKNIFREYDIRGCYPKDINEDISYTIGRAYGSYLRQLGKIDCIVGRDNRYSSDNLADTFIAGVTESGVHVLDLGLVTTPMYYYACYKKNIDCGCMITASHNPKDDNGYKISFGEYQNAKGQEILDFYDFLMRGEFATGDGIHSRMNIKDSYISYLLSSIEIKRPLKVIVDCGNGTTSPFINDVFAPLSPISEVLLYAESNPEFPHHHPDPSVDENMRVLQNAVIELKADIGVAYDGDGDRLGVVDDKGRLLRMDEVMALFVRDLSSIEGAKFLYDVKCGMTLTHEIEKCGVEGVMVRTGNSYTKALTKELNCIMGGEYSGHVYFRDKFLGFDSGIYASLRVLELLSKSDVPLSEMVDSLEHFSSTPELKFPCSDETKFEVIEKVKDYVRGKNYSFLEIDGIRVPYPNAWVSIRASNTGPNITMRIEASSKEQLESLQKEFEGLLHSFLESES